MDKNYAILRVDKIKTAGDMHHRYEHNMRTGEVLNADPLLYDNNFDAQDLLNGLTYQEMFDNEITDRRVDGTMDKVRRNAVLGFEVVLRYSREAGIRDDQDAWVQKNVEWLNRTFNPPGGVMTYTNETGEQVTKKTNNVKSVIVHNDEGVPHIHAFVIPIDEKGRLNAFYYTGGPAAMRRMQDSYAEAMEEFGLARGERKSVARPEEIRSYYGHIKRAVNAELPEIIPGETIEEYRARANETYRDALCTHRDEIVKMNQRVIAAYSTMTEAKEELNGTKARAVETEEKLERILDKEDLTDEDYRMVRRAVRREQDFEEAVQQYPDQQYARRVQEDHERMIRWQRDRKRKRARQSRAQ